MEYNNYSKEQLIQRIEELEMLNRQLLDEKEQEDRLDFAWTGNLGHWYWNVRTNTVTFNPLKVITLGYQMDELPEKVTYQFFTDKLHPEDHSKAMQAMMDHLYGKAEVYEVEYRIKAKDGSYRWYYDRGKVTQKGDNGKPQFLAGIVFDITEKKEMQLELERENQILAVESVTDGLTKINNHRAIIDHLQREVVNSNINNQPLTIALFDLDDFKNVNDTMGHVNGDKVLRDTAAIMMKNIRGTDHAGRYGGEEFLVIFPNTELSHAINVAERIRKSVENNVIIDGLKITISGGLWQYSGETMADFVHFADENLYKAKRNGKNQIVYQLD
ncbi:sensor domain-containing diguanylate cyclase [Gudongella oleilytica]|jgi:diguanylate cyclase (GGDEF)-like protein/PAS domain S-box-containing protein|uniref:sensor domain-containing diguanylate cyclase n=1 Tax=Gudongella oleilytica TaxID=1582259 RepID=UPI000FF8AB02|nr:sensor domain-containing diguanylate cyclase [Gudongella oleilytica]HMM70496.1 diguanylate cyclase [Gudongella oleilytica]